jgi:hypothetical protein
MTRCALPALQGAVDRLTGHLHHARHDGELAAGGEESAGPGDALSQSQPRKCFPRDLELVGLAAEGTLELADLLLQILLAPALVLARQGGLAALEDPGQHDLQSLLGAALFPSLCRLDLLGGRAAILGAVPDASSAFGPSSASGLIQSRWVSTRARGPGQ